MCIVGSKVTGIFFGSWIRVYPVVFKKHPCGSYEWEVARVGVDIGLLCQGCGRRILLPRSTFNKRLKGIVAKYNKEDHR